MAQGVDEQRASYPLPAYNFRVVIDGQSMSFVKVSGLQREHDSVVYRHGLSAFEGEQLIKYYRDKFVELSLERGAIPGAAQWLYSWLEGSEPKAMELDLCDAAGRAVIRWKVARALALKLSAPSFDANSNETAIESLTIKAAGITVEEAS